MDGWVDEVGPVDSTHLLLLLPCRLTALPPDEASFFDLLKTYFPAFYDIKVGPSACQPV